VTLLEYFPIRRGSGGSQKPFSSLSEGVRGMFTIVTEVSEITSVPPPHPRDTMSTWSLVRVNID
jgi:hypothetical protein